MEIREIEERRREQAISDREWGSNKDGKREENTSSVTAKERRKPILERNTSVYRHRGSTAV
jgi:hypothetical protein